MSEVNPASLVPAVAWGGFILAFVFGFVGNRTNFCTMGAVSDVVNMGDWNRMRMWLLAIAVAIIGANALELAGVVKLSNSIYPAPNFTWLSYVVGGLLFGIGMTLGSGCGSKTLIRVGGGNLKSLVVLVFMAIAAYMTLRGLFGSFRVGVLEPVNAQLAGGQDLPTLLARWVGGERRTMTIAAAAVIGGGLLVFALMKREFRQFDYLLGGVVVGLVIVGGWYVSGKLGYVHEHPDTLQEAWVATNTGRMESLSFVAPQAFGLELLMFWTDKSKIVTFGIASALGVIVGSAVYALVSQSFRLEAFRDAGDMLRHIVGGILMGFGGVVSLGCTIGQGITGFSTLALGSIITFFAIVAGAAATMKYEYWRLMKEA
ncbi:MAG TPA: YeeE/YedE family protein [Burkholderiales bacterium]|nr:YeeE/YedE family protein [Burkholderiales bacterium]